MYNSIQDIKQAVKKNNGILTLRLGILVKASPSGLIRSTPGNVRTVCTELAQEDMGYICKEAKPNQNTLVRVYKLDSDVASIIDAVLNPSKANDDVTRCASLLNQIQEMLCG